VRHFPLQHVPCREHRDDAADGTKASSKQLTLAACRKRERLSILEVTTSTVLQLPEQPWRPRMSESAAETVHDDCFIYSCECAIVMPADWHHWVPAIS